METPFKTEIIRQLAYTYKDYLILPEKYDSSDEKQTCCQVRLCKNILLNLPVVGSNMGHLGGRMAEKIAQLGGIGILSQDFSLAEILKRITRVKKANPYFHMPIVLRPDDRATDAMVLMMKRHFDCVIVVDDAFYPVGLATQKYLSKVAGWEYLRNVMKKDIIIVDEEISTEKASEIMLNHRINHLPVVDQTKRLVGCLTPMDITLRIHNYQPALDDQGRLRIGVALGMKPKEGLHPIVLAQKYLDAGVDLLVLDVANGYLSSFAEFVAEMRKELGDQVPIIAGNVADYCGTMKLLEAGSDSVKVGIGPGGACTTRRETGVGVPQASAVEEAVRAVNDFDGGNETHFILADGGIRDHHDVAISLLIGAHAVMIGSLFSGTYESAFETEIIDNEMWKRWRGNASSSAATYRRQEVYGEKYITEDLEHNEGADGIVKVTGSVTHKIFQLIEKLKRTVLMTNSDSISEFQSKRSHLLRLKTKCPSCVAEISQLSFEDLYIKPQPSSVLSRKEVSLRTNLTADLSLNIPYIALPSVFIQKKICTIMAQLGGIGFISRKKPYENVDVLIERITKVKQNHPYYFFPSIQEKNEEIGKTIDFLHENALPCVVIVKDIRSGDLTPVGIATIGDLMDRPRTDTLQDVVKTNIVMVTEGFDLYEASNLMLDKGIHHLPVIDKNEQLIGVITPKDITLRVLYGLKPNVDSHGRLRVGVAIDFNPLDVDQCYEDALHLAKKDADVILIETANGFNRVYLNFIEKLKSNAKCPIIATGLCNYEGVKAAMNAGADIVKVGSAFFQVPHIEAVAEGSRAAQEMNKTIITDDLNQIVNPRDAHLSLLMGANAVGLRHILAPTFENSVQYIPKTDYPVNLTRYQLIQKTINNVDYILEDLEGDSQAKAQQFEAKESVINVIIRLITGLRSSCTYSNSIDLEEYKRKAQVGVQSSSGYFEGNPHAFQNPTARPFIN